MRSLSSKHSESSHFAAPRKAFTHTTGYKKSLRDGKRLASLRQLEGRSAPLPPNLPRLVHAQTPRVALCHSISLAYKMLSQNLAQ